MGIDIYAKWRGIKEDEIEKQYTGFNIWAGNVGYLREAYHGEPYATRELVPEAFESEDGEAPIPAEKLRERLSKVLRIAKERDLKLYKSSKEDLDKTLQSFVDFVELCEKMEKETGEPVKIVASY